jgi:hypothetical protein
MKSFAMFLAVVIAAVAGIAASQEATTTRETAPTPPASETARSVTTSGEIVRYDAGKTIVIRQSDSRVVTYALVPTLSMPPEVQVGHRVTIFAESSADGVVRVTRVATVASGAAPADGPAAPTTADTRETEKAPADGQVRTTAERTEIQPSGAETKTQITAVYGTVTAYEPGRSITVVQPSGTTFTYAIDSSSALPKGIATGKTVVVRTITRPGASRPLVRKVTYSTSSATTKKNSLSM